MLQKIEKLTPEQVQNLPAVLKKYGLDANSPKSKEDLELILTLEKCTGRGRLDNWRKVETPTILK